MPLGNINSCYSLKFIFNSIENEQNNNNRKKTKQKIKEINFKFHIKIKY